MSSRATRTTTDTAAVVKMVAGAADSTAAAMSNEECGIREVWSYNLEEEFKSICKVVQDYPYVAMDTEFPGVVAKPIGETISSWKHADTCSELMLYLYLLSRTPIFHVPGEFTSSADYQYQLLRCNVDLLKIIQLGLTFMDERANLPPDGVTTWQFNFKFNLTEDMYAEDSIDLLQNSGIQFDKHERDGIDPVAFAEMMLTSGLVLMEEVKWLSFHSGYDFGYLIHLLTNQVCNPVEIFFQIKGGPSCSICFRTCPRQRKRSSKT